MSLLAFFCVCESWPSTLYRFCPNNFLLRCFCCCGDEKILFVEFCFLWNQLVENIYDCIEWYCPVQDKFREPILSNHAEFWINAKFLAKFHKLVIVLSRHRICSRFIVCFFEWKSQNIFWECSECVNFGLKNSTFWQIIKMK